MEARLVHRDHIHVSLAEDLVGRFGPFCNMKSVQISALVEDLGLRRVEIFRLCVPHYASSETDHLSPDIHDRENDPVPEFVVHASFFIEGRYACLENDIVRKSAAAQVSAKVVPRSVRKSQSEVPHRCRIKFSLHQIPEPFYPLLRPQQFVIIDRGFFIHCAKELSLLFTLFCLFAVVDLGKFDPGPVCQCLQRLFETVVFIFHEKSRRVSSGPASEAVEHLLGL